MTGLRRPKVAIGAAGVALIGCALSPPILFETAPAPHPSESSAPSSGPAVSNAPINRVPDVGPRSSPGLRETRPWWHDRLPGVYTRSGTVSVMGVGRSTDHRHPAEGFLRAKVKARLAVRRAAGGVAFDGAMPEPYLEDLFISPTMGFWALYRLDVPGNAGLPDRVAEWVLPARFRRSGRYRIGRHTFENSRHLFLECDVEGPFANPDWGQTRASARLLPRRRP